MGEGAESAVMYTGVTCVNTEHKSASEAETESQMEYILVLVSLTNSGMCKISVSCNFLRILRSIPRSAYHSQL